MPSKDETLAYLLDLDGEEIIYDGGYVARFTVKRIAATPEKPHGVSYSLTFHAPVRKRREADCRFLRRNRAHPKGAKP
jgi:hypothetical protein